MDPVAREHRTGHSWPLADTLCVALIIVSFFVAARHQTAYGSL
jgi:hypothetical protein